LKNNKGRQEDKKKNKQTEVLNKAYFFFSFFDLAASGQDESKEDPEDDVQCQAKVVDRVFLKVPFWDSFLQGLSFNKGKCVK
jgi:hypothetical protein